MLVKVRNKENGNIQHISRRAYELAKKRYDFLGNETNDRANVSGEDPESTLKTTPPQIQQEPIQVQTEAHESPNPQPTAEKERVAEAVAENTEQPKRRGRPAKTQNQISSPAAISEV